MASLAFGQRACSLHRFARFQNESRIKKKASHSATVKALYADDDEQFAPVSKGDGFSFYGGKYSSERDKTDDWWDQGDFIYAYSAAAAAQNKVKDPLFGLKLGAQSQVSEKAFRWFYVEQGDQDKPAVLLLHGLGSQAYSFRNVMPSLSSQYRTIAVDWLGCGFSDKPQAGYGFSYTVRDYAKALEALVAALGTESISIVVQGHFAPAVVEFARANPDKVLKLVLINPPVAKDAKLPPSLLSFTNPLLGEILVQDPYKASDGLLAQSGYYSIKEVDKMVYRKPFLTSGAAGFALVSITKVLKQELKENVAGMRDTLSSSSWKVPTSLIGGRNDRWLGGPSSELESLARSTGLKLVQLSEVGHHAQEDDAEGIADTLKQLLLV